VQPTFPGWLGLAKQHSRWSNDLYSRARSNLKCNTFLV